MNSVLASCEAGSIEQVLEKDGVYPSITSGRSMRPLFKTHRDMIVVKRCDERPKKYDVVLYRVGEKYILHRIIGINEGKKLFIIRGDNTYKKEYVPFSKVIARLTSFTRKGKHGSVDDRSYKIYSRIWNYIYPIRYALYFCKRIAARLYRIVFKKTKNKAD